MSAFFIFSLIILSLYNGIIAWYIWGWEQIKPEKESPKMGNEAKVVFLSVIVALKNESENITRLVDSLYSQNLSGKSFEVIFIDDHSTDNSYQQIEGCIQEKSNFKVARLAKNKAGKKEAIAYGIKLSCGNYIVTTDADCWHSKGWLSEIYHHFKTKSTDLLIGYVAMTGNVFFEQLQVLEFSSLTASSAGAAGCRSPIMCNGANLAYKKSLYNLSLKDLEFNIASGDDIFLLHAAKKYGKQISFLKGSNVPVITKAEKGLFRFFRQRIRWSGKSSSYKDKGTVFVAIIVALINCLLLFYGVQSIFGGWQEWVVLMLLKGVFDFVLLFKVSRYYKRIKTLVYFPTLMLIYPFYIVLTAAIGLIVSQSRWK